MAGIFDGDGFGARVGEAHGADGVGGEYVRLRAVNDVGGDIHFAPHFGEVHIGDFGEVFGRGADGLDDRGIASVTGCAARAIL